jgi:uncharacterized protein YdaU (DUF1376 family)
MSARWYKRCGADFIHGTMMLSLEEKGAYSLCLDLIYDRGGPIHDDARWLAGVCGVSLRKWNSIRERLLSLGKLHFADGMISNARAALEIASTELSSRERAESGAKGGRKRAENERQPTQNNDLAQAELKREEKIREEKKREATASPRARRADGGPGTRLSDDWEPVRFTEATVAREVMDRRGTEWGRRVLESFRNHWRSANGPTSKKRDWQAAWANWTIEQDNRDGQRSGTHSVAGSRSGSVTGFGRTGDAAARFAARG